MIDDEGHLLPDPAEIYLPKDFSGMGAHLVSGIKMHPDVVQNMVQKSDDILKSYLQERVDKFLADEHPKVFPDFDKMVAHLARVHSLHQDEITLLLASWFNSKKTGLKFDATIL